ncbi:hypothetical protein PMAYCL1PPCAC_16389, partial [Pristionchus mayeri]
GQLEWCAMSRSEMTYPGVISGHGELKYYVPYQYGAIIGPERWWHGTDLRSTFLAMQAYWSYTIWIAIFYVACIHTMQKAMEKRPAFRLRRPLIAWNTVLALFSLLGTVRTFEELHFVVSHHSLLDSVSYSLEFAIRAGLFGLAQRPAIG